MEEFAPLISVIVPVYNAEKYLNRCIDSVLNQTFQDFELILINDGSTDRSGEICERYKNLDKRIKVVCQENAGQAQARNNAIKIARGEWISFLDSDDAINPNLLAFLYDAAVACRADLSACDFLESDFCEEVFFGDHEYTAQVKDNSEETFCEFFDSGKYYWTVWGKLIKKSIVQSDLFTPGKYYEDNALIIRWLYSSPKIATVPLKLYFYQINPEGTTKSKVSEKYFDFLWAMEQQVAFFAGVRYELMLKKALKLYFCSYEDRFRAASALKRFRLKRTAITFRALLMWAKYKKRVPEIKGEWKHILRVSFYRVYKAFRTICKKQRNSC